MSAYRGRFAPSPTGPLHAGSMVAALASWLDARAHGGTWLVRIEDVDTPRSVAGAGQHILHQLAACKLFPDQEPVWQSSRSALYETALENLLAKDLAYPCACSRRDIELALQELGRQKQRNAELVYPGTCRNGLQGRQSRAIRFNTSSTPPGNLVQWTDRRLGEQMQDVQQTVGDFVLRRADDLYSYQLAVVVDDASQGITHVVRGEDLADNTARQVMLQRALELPTPVYMHTQLVVGSNGEKLSKQNGAVAVETGSEDDALCTMKNAAAALGLTMHSDDCLSDLLAGWTAQWKGRWAYQRLSTIF